MKKIIIVALMLFVGFNGFSQLRFGISGAPQISWLKSDYKPTASDGLKLGINYGLDIDYFFGDNYAFSTGVCMSNTGGELKYDMDTTIFNHDTIVLNPKASVVYKLQYIQIPLALKFKTNEIGYMTYFGQLGFTAQVRTKVTATATDGNIKDEKAVDDTQFMNMGYHIGGGLEYSLGGSTSLIVGVYYTNGFIDVIKVQKYDYITAGKKAAGNKVDYSELEGKEILNSVTLRVGVMF